ncbi:DNA/RNA helicase [Candidatus Campbellbacteria bacterium CG22_combo_CG10-13_8_21_14_all_36_13]|uniref:DNA/RNA helicase n=1 Tax=Candidatus Campbellbacteria bacterium CG22_combo_CG10-13_8_21_14_all_36_13 TaxID=1974529 RepID=A0A2H0DYA3_9BACT|nr:MAG: DNA/RNA helicase [Candidatus Campbellbacteria bacterium CG22_combo_CG10-13_8_21_14_all_36_13]
MHTHTSGKRSGGHSYSNGNTRVRKFRSGPRRGGSSGAGKRSGFVGRRSGGGNRFGGRKKSTLDISSFINKAVVATETVAHFVPDNSFNDFNIDKQIKATLVARGYEHPTPIQDKAIPHVLRGEDVVGLANTGTGKTAAFLIPIINKILHDKKQQVIILAPTRELAIQIEDELKLFASKLGMHSVVCVGGMRIGAQIQKLRNYNHFIIGTPGRTIDLIKRGNLKLSNVKTVVLDEADRMLDMGFINDIRYILREIPKERQTLCFSATLAPEIKRLINDFLIEPVTISVKTQDTPTSIEQDIVKVEGRDKTVLLAELLQQNDFKKVLVFGRTKHGVGKLSQELNRKGLKTESIHGNKSHSQRQSALKRFKENRIIALVATDVAARGLDITDITHVINFDIPETYDDYIHRIGRTGRGSHKGKAITFVG